MKWKKYIVSFFTVLILSLPVSGWADSVESDTQLHQTEIGNTLGNAIADQVIDAAVAEFHEPTENAIDCSAQIESDENTDNACDELEAAAENNASELTVSREENVNVLIPESGEVSESDIALQDTTYLEDPESSDYSFPTSMAQEESGENEESLSRVADDRLVAEGGEEELVNTTDGTETENPANLLNAYAEKQIYSAVPRPGLLMAPKNNWRKLNDASRAVYWTLREMIAEVAEGNRRSTEFYITVESLGLSQTSWTDTELGTAIISGDGTISQEAKDKVKEIVGIDTRLIIQALLGDCPYELYWYDKTASTRWTGYSYLATAHSISIEGTMVFRFPVVEAYALGEFQADDSYGQSIQSALNNAQSIVSTYAACGDYEKLDCYRAEICNLTSYNYSVLYEATPYGNPWQLIWVFDGNPETRVVCEGYAKAFQYLCDLSTLSDGITAYTVSGYLDGTGHMWNIVTMEDGCNYLVDVTNCDEGMAGYPNFLFLTGYETGSVEDNYICGGKSGTLTYTYDAETYALFTTGDLKLADHRYREREETIGSDCMNGHQYAFDKWIWDEDRAGAEAVFVCERNEAHVLRIRAAAEKTVMPSLGGYEYTVALPAEDSPDSREHTETNIELVSGWLRAEDGTWYYLDESHVISTGWVKVNGTWYYMSGSGAMQTGWVKVNGTWYYMNGSGAMQTGWVKVNGTWYYMSGSGAMQTGWVKVNGTWYYMNGSGAMQTGWAKVNNKWYYMDSSGAMLANTSRVINGKTYKFNASGVCTNA